jgi:outer membrane protein OmpA-like peptidoglycan-associated protein/tetratricopeptide (TPR) repeat protein
MKKIELLSLLLVLCGMAFAQKRQLKEAEVHFQYGEYNLAIPLYEAYLQAEPNGKNALEVHYKLGICHLNTSQRGKSLPHLEWVYKQNPQFDKNLTYYLAQSYHIQHQFDKAEQFYKMVTKESQWFKEVPKHLEECNYGKMYVKNPKRVTIENMGDVVNSSYAEYVPAISDDENVLIFTARKPNTTGGGKDPSDQEFFEDIYVCEKKDGKWGEPKPMPQPINSNSHDACIALSPDGKTLFVYKTGGGKEKLGDIYYSEKTNDGWTKPRDMGSKINSKSREPSISITHDGKTVYFSSDRPGGFGGLDIYKSTKNEKGEWGEPINLGATINTPYDEDSPFIHNENTLYFSSQGHTSMGGYDIFVTKLENNQWSKPENLGYPINTADDDIYYVVSKNEERGYLSSARAGGFGEKDLYVVHLKEPTEVPVVTTTTTTTTPDTVPQRKPTYKTVVKGTITDAKTQEKLVADIVLISLKENIIEQELVSKEPIGKYETDKLPTGKSYLINVTKEGYLFHSESFLVPPQPERDQEIVVDIALLRLSKGEKINLTVFYDFDKDFLRLESKPELERLVIFLQKYPNVKVEIAGHTDAIGTEQKNQGLSERRAQSVVRYLIERGIDPKRLTAKGYGESKPVATNETEEGRQMNRRTECVVVEY